MKKILITAIIIGIFPSLAIAKGTENIFYYFPNQDAYKSVEENYQKIDILAPQIYTLGYDLKIGEAESEDILSLAKKKNIDVMPLVVQTGFNKALMTIFLDRKEAQDAVIEQLIVEAKARDFIGWQFDFENINHLDRDKYTEFIKNASKKFKKKNLILSVAVIPRTSDYDKNSPIQDWSSGYEISDVAKYADFVSLMSYDDPKSQGPVASLDYVNKALDHTLKTTPASKISLGVPFYCWQWEVGNPKKIANISYNRALETQTKYKNNGVLSMYIKEYGAEVFLFVKDDRKINLAWCDNHQSIKEKSTLAKEKGFRGLSAWALGQEDARVWKILN